MKPPDLGKLRACLSSKEFAFIKHCFRKWEADRLNNLLSYDPQVQAGEMAKLMGEIKTYRYLASDRLNEDLIARCEEALAKEAN